jgi:Uma2 family endonuclease
MSAATLDRSDCPDPGVYRLTVDAYHRMIDAGIFNEDDRVELINGELRTMAPIKAGHAGKNKRLNRLLSARVGDNALVAVQDPLTLPEHSEPEPDLMLLRLRDDYYETKNPTPEDVLLVIEISDSSLHYDRDTKVPLYAAHDVAEVWLIDLPARRLAIYRNPGPEGYRQILIPDRDQSVSPQLLPSVKIDLSELWR